MEGNDTIESDDIFSQTSGKQRQLEWRSVRGSLPQVQPRPSSILLKQNTILGLSTPVQNDPEDSESNIKMKFECAVCFETYSESGSHVPRSLSCGHTFCTGCLGRLVKDGTLSCPKCHHKTSIPQTLHGVNSLVKNYGVLEIMYSQPSLFDKGANVTVQENPSKLHSSVPLCEEHGDQLSSYCQKDDTLVCSSCLLYGKHKGHDSKLLKEAAADYRQMLVKLTSEVAEKISSMVEAVQEVERVMEKVNSSSEQLSKKVDSHFGQLVKILEKRCKELKVDVLHRSQTRIESLMEQRESIQSSISAAQQCHSSCTQLLSGDNYTVIEGFQRSLKAVEKVFINPPSLDPVGRDDLMIEFPPDTSEELESQFSSYGNLKSGVGMVKYLCCEPFHDGIRLYWQGHNYVDSIGMTYALQMSHNNEDFVNIYRGGDTKYTWRWDVPKQESKERYYFRVRVQTCEGVVGPWCDTVSCYRALPGWFWDIQRRNIKIELNNSRLEAWSRHSSNKDWTSLAGDQPLTHGQYYMEIEIVELARHNFHREWFTKIALGVVEYSEATIKLINWQDCKNPVGRFSSVKSWGFEVIAGIKIASPSLVEEDYGGVSTLQVGDRIGMLIDSGLNGVSISFFLNGQDLGVAFTNVSSCLLPVLSVCDKFHIRLRFPPVPYVKRNPRLTLFLNSS